MPYTLELTSVASEGTGKKICYSSTLPRTVSLDLSELHSSTNGFGYSKAELWLWDTFLVRSIEFNIKHMHDNRIYFSFFIGNEHLIQ